MFQTDFPFIIRSSKLHIQCQVFVRPLLLPAASLARLAVGNNIGRCRWPSGAPDGHLQV